jgi:tetratricopeptide (TPR) repeat protein
MPNRPSRTLKSRPKIMRKHCLVLVLCIGAIVTSPSQARRVAVADPMPAITATTLAGQPFQRSPGLDRPILVAFLMAGQKASQQAAEDLDEVIASYSKDQKIDGVIVMDEPVFKDVFQRTDADPQNAIHLIHDDQKELWGQFHIIAAPTVIIADKSDKVTAVIAGHGYDFIPSLRFQLNEVLGIAQTMTAEEVGKVKTVQNNTNSAKIQRHLKMAKMLQNKGKVDASLQQLAQAQKLDPNDLQVALQIGRLNCTRSKPDLALKALEGRLFTTPADQAASELITGWANRLSGDFQAAREHLLKATTLDPASARAFFELGQVYEATSQSDLALKAYKDALSILMKDK